MRFGLFISSMIQRVREIELYRKWLRADLINNLLSNGFHFSSAKTKRIGCDRGGKCAD